jgi:hypothetical protein
LRRVTALIAVAVAGSAVLSSVTAVGAQTNPPPLSAGTGDLRHGGRVVTPGSGAVQVEAHTSTAAPDIDATPVRAGGGPVCRGLVGVGADAVTGPFPDVSNSAAGGLTVFHQLQGPRERFALYCQTQADLWTFSGVGPFQPTGGGPAPAETAELALSQIVVPSPGIRTAPALELTGLVGIATWLWVEPSTWRPLSASASAGGLTVTATVTPTSVTWEMGEGRGTEPVVCDGPGTPYRLDVADALQRTDCSYTFQWASTDHRRGSDDGLADDDDLYHASATVTWSVRWAASNGESGALASITSTTSFDLRVGEVQAVVCYETDLSECAG